MKIRKRIIYGIRKHNTDAALTKALAMILFYQMRVLADQGRNFQNGAYNNRLENFSYNRMRRVTGLHISTIRKRMATAKRMGWARMEQGALVIDCKALKSSHNKNNYGIDNGTGSITELQDMLLSLIIVNVQETKDHARDVFKRLKSPKNLEEYKRARREARERHPGRERYEERGTSYKCLSESMGVGTSKLKSVLRFAEGHGMIRRKRNITRLWGVEAEYVRKLCKLGLIDEYTEAKYGRPVRYFTNIHGVFLCFPNTYSVPSSPILPTGTY